MGSIALLLLLLLMTRDRPSGRPATATPLHTAAHHAAKRAHAAHQRAEQTGHPADQAAAAKASEHAAVLTAAVANHTAQAAAAPKPWPQSMPAGLPPFPSGWQADTPPPPAVVQRAVQLLRELWASGSPGARKTEQTDGRWITYLAQFTSPGVRGVTAWRPKAGFSPASFAPSTASPSSGLAILKQGSSGPAVVKLQQHLGLNPDGKFGPKTRSAVVAFQTSHGLSPDGVVGPMTWAALTSGKSV